MTFEFMSFPPPPLPTPFLCNMFNICQVVEQLGAPSVVRERRQRLEPANSQPTAPDSWKLSLYTKKLELQFMTSPLDSNCLWHVPMAMIDGL